MDSSKQKRYDEMVEETKYVIDKFEYNYEVKQSDHISMMAAILVASEHSNEDLGQLAGFITKTLNRGN